MVDRDGATGVAAAAGKGGAVPVAVAAPLGAAAGGAAPAIPVARMKAPLLGNATTGLDMIISR